MPPTIHTPRLTLIPCDPELLQSAIFSSETLSEHLGIAVAEGWTEFGTGPLQYALDKITENPSDLGWMSYFPVHRQEGVFLGSCGFKGSPTAEGTVEIGYEIAPAYRNQGLATEVAQALVSHAFASGWVKSVLAHTLAEENASARVLRKCGFVKVDEYNDPDDGPVWRWELTPP
jgi:RimJ/RimL family protein N-acetyltransferase